MAGVVVAAAVVLGLAACTGSGRSAPTTSTVVTGTRTVVTTQTASLPAPNARAFTSVAPLPPHAKPRTGETEKSCPYLRTGLQLDPTDEPNAADLNGSRIYRVTRLTQYSPLGCRFYFYAPPYDALVDIRPTTYPSAAAARNAMISAARSGTQIMTERRFSGNLDGISFRTTYYGPDGARDWAFAFAKGTRMVVVLTHRSDTSRNALYIAQAIAGKF